VLTVYPCDMYPRRKVQNVRSPYMEK